MDWARAVSELQELAVDARGTPKPIFEAHAADQLMPDDDLPIAIRNDGAILRFATQGVTLNVPALFVRSFARGLASARHPGAAGLGLQTDFNQRKIKRAGGRAAN